MVLYDSITILHSNILAWIDTTLNSKIHCLGFLWSLAGSQNAALLLCYVSFCESCCCLILWRLSLNLTNCSCISRVTRQLVELFVAHVAQLQALQRESLEGKKVLARKQRTAHHFEGLAWSCNRPFIFFRLGGAWKKTEITDHQHKSSRKALNNIKHKLSTFWKIQAAIRTAVLASLIWLHTYCTAKSLAIRENDASMICVVDITTCDVESGLSQHSVHQSSPGLSRNQIFLSKIKQFHGRGETGQMPVSSNVMTAHRPLVVIRKFANGNAQKLRLGFDLRKQRRRQKHTKTIKNQSHNSCVK